MPRIIIWMVQNMAIRCWGRRARRWSGRVQIMTKLCLWQAQKGGGSEHREGGQMIWGPGHLESQKVALIQAEQGSENRFQIRSTMYVNSEQNQLSSNQKQVSQHGTNAKEP